jgi:hypothetical protein
MASKTQSGFSGVIGIVTIVVVIGAIGFIGWRLYSQQNKPTSNTISSGHITTPTPSSSSTSNSTSSQQNTTPTNDVTDYYAPVNISFTHDKKWSYDTSGEIYGYAGHPNEKNAQLTLSYQGANDTTPNRYTIGFTSDSIPPTSEPDLITFSKLGQVTLGNQTLYILKAYYDANVSTSLDKIVTSSCPDKACNFQLNGTGLYFYAGAGKGIQAPVPLDDSMVPEITSILGSMRIGKQ